MWGSAVEMADDRTLSFLLARLLMLTIGLGAGSQAFAAGGPPEAVSCNFAAFVEETDPAGLNVRAAPSASAPVLGTLPPVWTDDSGMRARVFVKVSATAKGWFRIHGAFEDEALTGQPARPVYEGEGWVSGRKLVVKSQANAGRARPDPKAAVAIRLKDGLLFDGSSTIAAGRLVDCRGSWVQVEYEEARFAAEMRPYLQVSPVARAGLPKGRLRAWLDQICGIQETSCDGPSSLDTQ